MGIRLSMTTLAERAWELTVSDQTCMERGKEGVK